MKVNPRVPKRTQKGVLSAPVIKGILETLENTPEDMALKNQGIHLLVKKAEFDRKKGGIGELTVHLADPNRHGIVNGGHTYAAIRQALEDAEEGISNLNDAFVMLHVLQGIDAAKVPEIAEGLNRSKQVDDPSLANLQGDFNRIRVAMKGREGENDIAYHQGDDGSLYIAEVLGCLQLFNRNRYSEDRHPHLLYSRQSTGLQYFQQDLKIRPSPMDLLIPRTHEILYLANHLRYETPAAAKRVGFEFGRMKTGRKRAGASTFKNTELPFINKTMNHRVPKGWIFPMLAAFRANVDWNPSEGKFEWIIPLEEIVPKVMEDLVRVCVTEHRDNNMKPEYVGRREAAYRQCYDKVLLFLARAGKAV